MVTTTRMIVIFIQLSFPTDQNVLISESRETSAGLIHFVSPGYVIHVPLVACG